MASKRNKWLWIVLIIPVVVIWACINYSRWWGKLSPGDVIDSLYSKNKLVTRELDNGLQILVLENNSAPVVSIRYYVKTGSVFEGKYGGMGISHYVEHLVSSGSTSKISEIQVQEILRELGGASNAYTSKDSTCYYINTSPENFEKAFNLITANVFEAALSPEEADREKGVIIKEIERGLDKPESILFKTLDELTYGDHPAAFPVIGYLERFKKIKREDILDYYTSRYVPNNVVLVICGNVKAAKILPKMEVSLLKYERGPEMNRTLPESSPQLTGKRSEKYLDIAKAHYIMSFKTVDIYDEDLYALDLLAEILSAGESSVFQKEIKHNRELVDVISSASFTPSYAPGYFYIYSVLEAGKMPPSRHAVLKEIRHVKEKGVKKSVLEKAKNIIITNYIFRLREIEAQASDIGSSYLISGDPFFTRRYLKGILDVRSEDLKRVARKYFNQDNLIEISVAKKEAAAPVEEKEKEESSDIKEFSLDNGVKLIMKNNPSTPTVAIVACFKGGLVEENKDNSGIFNFMASVMDKGTEEISAARMAERIDRIGGNVSVAAGNNNIIIGISVLKDEIKEGISILKEIVSKANFNGIEIEKQRRLILSSIERLNDNPLTEAAILARKTYFGEHPYGMELIGSKTSVESIARSDLQRVYAEYVKPDNCIMAVFGDIDFKKTINILNGELGEWRTDKFREKEIPGFAPPEDYKIVQKKTTKNNAIIIEVYPSCGFNSEDYYCFDVIDSLVSGIDYPGGWLHEALRGNDKLVYMVHAQFMPKLKTGAFMVFAETSPDKIQQVLDKINGQFDRLRNKEFTDEELAIAKNICITMHQMGLQTNEEQAADTVLNLRYNRGLDFSKQYPGNIRKVTREDIEKCINKYFSKGPVTVVTSPLAIEF
ncbi:MAG: insulinase family protein [Candidatus Aureabacteria bacterium]|nr:insulinase family protein [Candidatus Auribacterota bacterium]